MIKKNVSLSLVLALLVGNVVAWRALLAQPGGGDPPPPVWAILIYPLTLNVSSDLTVSGSAAVANADYSLYAVRKSDNLVLQSASGTTTTDTNPTWTKALTKPGSAWPVCEAWIDLFHNNVKVDQVGMRFAEP
jgi:hypothetical protein